MPWAVINVEGLEVGTAPETCVREDLELIVKVWVYEQLVFSDTDLGRSETGLAVVVHAEHNPIAGNGQWRGGNA